jgi:CBS-domain-containing membrane protein
MDDLVEVVHASMLRQRKRFVAVLQGSAVTAVLERAHLASRLAADPAKATGRRRLQVRDVVHPGMACLPGDAGLDAAIRLLRATGAAAVPVLDEHHRLLGLVTAEQVHHAMRHPPDRPRV